MTNLAQAAYTFLLRALSAGRGIPWNVDATTTLRIDPRCRWIRNSDYERPVTDYLRARARPGDVFVDVGAHAGFYVMQMALWTAPDGRIVAFEPNPTARAVLRANVSLNGFSSRVTIEASAVGALAGTGALLRSGDTSGLSRLGNPDTSETAVRSIPVPIVGLDDYCSAHGVSPTWILVDTEGAELDVLRGAAALLRDTSAEVVVEMHAPLWDPDTTTPQLFKAFLSQTGRKAVPITGQKDPFTDYGTVVLARTE